jgi:predicted dehydrogenase
LIAIYHEVTMSEQIRVGVIGFGLAGRLFHTAVIDGTPGFKLQGIVKPTGDEAKVAYPSVPCYRTIEEMFADTSIRLMVVATPSHTHFEIAQRCLREQRHVVIDKPFTLTSQEAATLIEMARERNLLLSAYQNRRWDGDFKTVQQIVAGEELGRIVTYTSHFDRFRPEPRHGTWREGGGPGSGILFDLGAHLIDQATTLFGTPTLIDASIRIQRDEGQSDDFFDIRLTYQQHHCLVAHLIASTLARIPGPRFQLSGTRGSFVKYGLDPQEQQLKDGLRFDSPGFGEDPESAWGTMQILDEPPQRIPTERGDYRAYYENVRDALTGKALLAVTPVQAWRTTRLIELARKSSAERRAIPVDLSSQPE